MFMARSTFESHDPDSSLAGSSHFFWCVPLSARHFSEALELACTEMNKPTGVDCSNGSNYSKVEVSSPEEVVVCVCGGGLQDNTVSHP